uniref:Uncharacterized protein n=1 Tax=Tetradesmus obliquus TaxID=3088 RepID=A0A383VWS8_TETOB|eukprot:jgi/Sobl393_1/14418/SZX69380.1
MSEGLQQLQECRASATSPRMTSSNTWNTHRPESSPVCVKRPFGTVWTSSSHEPGSPVIKFNASLAPGMLLAQDIERQVRAGNPLPGSPHAGLFQVPAATAAAQDAAGAPSRGAHLYQPPVDLVVLSSQLQRLGPSTPFRYTAHHSTSPQQQQQQQHQHQQYQQQLHREHLLQQQQPLLSPPGRAGAAALASGGNVRWASDSGTQTVPCRLAADAARLATLTLHAISKKQQQLPAGLLQQ